MSTLMHDAIRIPKFYLTLTGIWPVLSSTVLHRIMSHVSFVVAFSFSLSMVMECSKHLDDYQILSEIVSILIPPTALVFKLVVFKLKSRSLLELMKHLDLGEFNYSTELKLLEKEIKFTRLLGNSYQVTAFMVILLYSITPFIYNVDLPIMFSYNVGRWFSMGMYAFQVLGLFNAVASNTSIDVLIVSLMGIGSAQIDILNSKISNLEYNSIEDNVEGKNDNDHRFDECIRHHNWIIRFVESLDDVFSWSIFILYVTSAVGICNVGFQLVHTPFDDPIQLAKMTFFFAAMLFQLLLYCWYGNEIILKSAAIRDACYESKWYDSDLKTRKSLIYIMERSKKPLFLTSGKFSIVSLDSFMSVIKTSYSYFALLQTLVKEEQL